MTPHLAALPSIEAAVDLGETEAAIARLPAMQREIIRLAGHEGMRYEEIAEVLGLPVGTVRSRLSRARARLRELMGIDEAAAERPTRWADPAPMRRAA